MTLPHNPPTDKDLKKIYEGYGAHVYQSLFIKWFFEKHTTRNMPFSVNEIPEKNRYDIPRIQLLIDVVRKIDAKTAFDVSFRNKFGLTYTEAHKQFVSHLETI